MNSVKQHQRYQRDTTAMAQNEVTTRPLPGSWLAFSMMAWKLLRSESWRFPVQVPVVIFLGSTCHVDPWRLGLCYNAEIYCINPIYCPIGSMYGIYIYMSMLTLGVYWWDPCHHIWHTSIQFTLDISKDSRCLWTTYRTYRTPKRHSTLRRAA